MNSPVPKAVRDQVQRAEQLMRERKAAQEATSAPEQNAAPVETPAPTAPEQSAQPVQETPPAPAPAAETPPQPAPQPEETWEHKYKVLQGMQQALAQERRELAEQNRQLRDLIARMQEQQRQAPPPQPQAPQTSLVKPEEVEEYGADLLDVIARKAREQYEPLIAQLTGQITELKQQLGGRMQQVEQVASVSAKDAFFSKLDTAVPYWEQLNTDAGFLNWLASADELSGVVRKEMFDRASSSFDAMRVAKFFETYASLVGVKPQPAAPAPSMAPTVPLANLATPPKSPSAPAPVTKKIWTRPEIAAFYENSRKGVYKGKEAERNRLERDIFDAGREGRIQ